MRPSNGYVYVCREKGIKLSEYPISNFWLQKRNFVLGNIWNNINI